MTLTLEYRLTRMHRSDDSMFLRIDITETIGSHSEGRRGRGEKGYPATVCEVTRLVLHARLNFAGDNDRIAESASQHKRRRKTRSSYLCHVKGRAHVIGGCERHQGCPISETGQGGKKRLSAMKGLLETSLCFAYQHGVGQRVSEMAARGCRYIRWLPLAYLLS